MDGEDYGGGHGTHVAGSIAGQMLSTPTLLPTQPPTSVDACPNTCFGKTCDKWVEDSPFVTCESLESDYLCDCTGCSCNEQDEIDICPSTCNGAHTCDELLGDHTCEELQTSYGCDCFGCGCLPAGGVCEETCYGYSCDYWSNGCDELESAYGCDCSSCCCGAEDCESSGGDTGEEGHAKYNGMAPHAKLAFFDIGDSGGSLQVPPNLGADIFGAAAKAGASIHTNSWGTSWNGYLSDDLEIDLYTYQHDDYLVLFAAGNDGDGGPGTIGSPATSKNCLSIGASEVQHEDWTNDTNWVSYFSSMGPTFDGRIKPDLVSPGMYIGSACAASDPTTDTCLMTWMAGTSMGCPVAAGTATLAREFLRKGKQSVALSADSPAQKAFFAETTKDICSVYECGPMNVTGALLRAVLIGGAQAMRAYDGEATYNGHIRFTSPPPDNIQGWGRVQLETSLPIMALGGGGNDTYTQFLAPNATLRTGESLTWSFVVSEVFAPAPESLVATICWMDPPCGLECSTQLLHDLDLVITNTTAGTNERFHSNGKTSWDNINTVERVSIGEGHSDSVFRDEILLFPGETYSITVLANALTEAETQSFALSVRGPGVIIGEPSRGDAFADDGFARTPKPTSTPTVAPTADVCVDPETQVEITLIDTYGDGWNNGYWTLSWNGTVEEGGTQLKTGFLPSGSEDSSTHCLHDGCYALEAGGGSYPEEIFFAVCGGFGSAEDPVYFCIADGLCAGGTSEAACSSASTCVNSDGAAIDVDGDACAAYQAGWCGYYDDSDFSANDMCCTCGGGNIIENDDDSAAELMATTIILYDDYGCVAMIAKHRTRSLSRQLT